MASIKELTLYSYYYSSASWRVRSVLALKKIPFKYQTVHLLNGEQRGEEYTKINPMGLVPSIKVVTADGKEHLLSQSLAIIQFLEENYPNEPIYPSNPILRAQSRAIADTISGGIQPLQNLETLVEYTAPLEQEPLNPEARKKVARYWINKKLINLEKLVERTAGKYCVGDNVTIADVCLVPQMFNARRFELDTSKYPLLKAIDERLQELEMFKASHPMACPDANPPQVKPDDTVFTPSK